MGEESRKFGKTRCEGEDYRERKSIPESCLLRNFLSRSNSVFNFVFSEPEDTYTGLVSAQPFGQESAFFLNSRVQIRFM